jgi:hypothetical protein
VLARAFGPATAEVRPGDPAAAFELASRLGLASRIAAMGNAGELEGGPVAGGMARQRAAAAASEMQAHAAAVEVARIAAAAGIDCCFLKGVAVDARGCLRPGSRGISDVDVLAAPREASELAARLAELGFRAGGSEYAHQLPAMAHPELGSVEIHRHLPGVHVGGGKTFATFPELAAAGHLEPWPLAGDRAWLPDVPLLVAHLLAHGIAQHGFGPQGYPLLRLVGDLIDLGFAAAEGERLAAAAAPLLRGTLDPEEVEAARRLSCALAAGELAAVSEPGSAGDLIRHLLAAHLDEGYAESLKLSALRRPLAEGSRLQGWWGAARQALWLSRAQVDAIYGRPRHVGGYLARRLWRPVDLLSRALRSAFARR